MQNMLNHLSSEPLEQLLSYLQSMVSPERTHLIEETLAFRTRYITVVLEDIHQSQNASAVIRTSDCYGIQQIHAVEHTNFFKINKDVTQGAAKWVDVVRHNDDPDDNVTPCLTDLKRRGFTVVATVPQSDAIPIDELPLDKPVALMFGRESTGLSGQALSMADAYATLPMYGFTASFNISVSAALILENVTRRLHQSEFNWGLTEDEKQRLRMEWYIKTITRGPEHVKAFLARDNDL